MLIATWNVNSVRARLPRVTGWLGTMRPDVLCMQETKVVDELFPHDEFNALGYQVETFGQKTYNGVAIASLGPMTDVVRGLPGDGPDDQKRVIEATVDGVRIINLYVPNGKAPDTEPFELKLGWLKRLRERLDAGFKPEDDLVMLGDINITPEDRDVYDPVALKETIHCTTREREALRHVMDFGLADVFRNFHDEAGLYSWWDFRGAMFPRNRGLRIDLILVTDSVAKRAKACEIDRAARGGEKPSDHTPVLLSL